MKVMLISVLPTRELRVAIVTTNGRSRDPSILEDFHVEKFDTRSIQGNIYKAKVEGVNDQLQAAFIDYGDVKQGLLPLNKIDSDYSRRSERETRNPNTRISTVLKTGDDILVQVEKDARHEKGATMTCQLQLHGQHVVLNTRKPGIKISRMIQGNSRYDLEAKLRQVNIPKNCGLVVRTSAMDKSLEELEVDIKECTEVLDLINRTYEQTESPRLLYEENNMVHSTLRDNLHSNIDTVYVDNADMYKNILGYVKTFMPDFNGKIKHYTDNLPMFTKYRVEAQTNKVFDRTVALPSGGQIAFDPTEALLAIDVNSARTRYNDNFRDMALNTNLEAADEIFRQIRLRDVGGLIVVDFIDLYGLDDIKQLERRVAHLCNQDRSRTRCEPLSSFGLMQLQRRRPRSSIYDTEFERCKSCGGHGYEQTISSVGHRIYREIEAKSHGKRTARIRIRVTPDVAKYLTTELRGFLSNVELKSQVKLEIIPDQVGENASYIVESFTNVYSKKPLKTESYDRGKPESGDARYKRASDRKTPAAGFQSAAVERPDFDRPKFKKNKVKQKPSQNGKSRVSVDSLFQGISSIFRSIYKRLFSVDLDSKSRKRQKDASQPKQRRSSTTRSKQPSSAVQQRVKRKVAHRSAPQTRIQNKPPKPKLSHAIDKPATATTPTTKAKTPKTPSASVAKAKEQPQRPKRPRKPSKDKVATATAQPKKRIAKDNGQPRSQKKADGAPKLEEDTKPVAEAPTPKKRRAPKSRASQPESNQSNGPPTVDLEIQPDQGSAKTKRKFSSKEKPDAPIPVQEPVSKPKVEVIELTANADSLVDESTPTETPPQAPTKKKSKKKMSKVKVTVQTDQPKRKVRKTAKSELNLPPSTLPIGEDLMQGNLIRALNDPRDGTVEEKPRPIVVS